MLRYSHSLFSLPKKSSAPQSGDLEPDAHPIIAGYRVEELLGQGPLGKVYRATKTATGERSVIRGFSRPEEADPVEWEEAKAQFRELLEAHRRIADLPNAPKTVQRVLAFGEENGLFWIATEYFEGVTLRNLLNREGVLPMTRIIEILTQVALAVDWMGEQGLPHTDLTPYNIVLVQPETGNGLPRLHIEVINFGLAHARSKYGSPYAAPEQMAGAAGDRRSDVYAVGAILHEMLTGVPLFTGSTPDEITQRVLYSPPQILIRRPQTAYKIVSAMVARRPEHRYATVGEAIGDLLNNREPGFPVPEPDAGAMPVPSPELRTPPVFVPDAIHDPQPTPGASVAVAAPPASPPQSPVRREITLQNYRLSDQDLIILRWRQLQEERRRDAERERQRERILPLVRGAVLVGLLGLAAFWMVGWRDRFRYAIVRQVTGTVRVIENGKPRALKAGDRLGAEHHPVITTGDRSSVTLAMPDNRLFLPANSSLGLLRLDYHFGTIRHLELFGGSVLGVLEPERKVRRFDIRVGKSLTIVRGHHFFLTLNRGTLFAGTKRGGLRVMTGGSGTPVSEGTAVAFPGDGGPPVAAAPTAFAPWMVPGEKALDKLPPEAPPVLATVEEKTIAPVISLGDTLLKLPSGANDQRAVGMSQVGLQAIATLLMTADAGEGLPETLDLTTLRELGMADKDRQRILRLFEGDRLLSYRRLPGGGYEIYARSKDSEKTLMRASNGQVEVLSEENVSEREPTG
ncbi:MAG: serine/threonine-protein kinase [Capsulimonadales bacterium]|nr:serine/threonine-protein kinase [Capsulimonadales bacterium]